MKLTPEQSSVLDILLNMLIKLLVALSSLAAFWFILFRILDPKLPALQTKALAIVDSILGGTMFVIVAHYFPVFKALTKRKTKPKTS